MKIIAIICACCIATTVLAQDETRLDAATAYLNTPVQQKLMNDLLSPEGIMAQMGLVGDRFSAKQKEIISTIVSEEMQSIRPAMEEALVTGMASNFSLAEINALTEFYSSPLGATAMAKMTPFMQQTMAAMGPSFQQMQGRLAQRLQTELSK